MPTISGTSGNDTLVGSGEADTLYGGGGNDLLNGGGGNDILYAGNLPGGGSGATTDALNGGAGDDVAIWTMDTWITNFDGGDGFDTADYGAYNQLSFPFSQPLTFQVGANGEIEASAFIFQRGQAGYNQVVGSFTNVERIITTHYGTVSLGAYTRAITVDGSAQADRITTGSGRDTIHGGAGADTISSGSGDDFVQGGQGDDILDGGAGSDTIEYSDAAGSVRVDLGAGTSSGAAGADAFTNFERVVGSNYDDVLIGSSGSDFLEGGRGADTLTGGAGADRFVFNPGDSVAGSFDTISDFTTSSDALIFGGAVREFSIVRQGTGSVVFVSYADQPQTVVPINAIVSAGDLLQDAQFYYLWVSVTMVGLATGETLIGGRVDDVIYGLDGDDIVIGGIGADALAGGAGADTFLYRSVTESTVSYSRNNVLTRPGYDNLFDFETGLDKIDVTAVGLGSVSIIRQDGSSFLFGGFPGSTLTFQLVAAGHDINANDLIGYSGGVYMVGSGQADVLIGGAGADGILGGDGADIITGGRGADALGGGADVDIFRYTAVIDSNASGYDNLFDFQTGVDKIDLTAFSLGFSAISILRQGGSSFVFLNAVQGGSMQIVAAGRDINANDFLVGTNNFYLEGSSGADTLIGSLGSDIIRGGDGADIIVGGGSSDSLYGGAGPDIFRYTAAGDSRYGTRGLDRILDFVSGTDKIDLSTARTGQNDVFGIAYLNGDAHLFIDMGGDGFNDLEIIVTQATLLNSDIIWGNGTGSSPIESLGKDHGPEVLPLDGSDDGGLSGRPALLVSSRDGGMLTLDDPSIPTGYHHDQNWWM